MKKILTFAFFTCIIWACKSPSSVDTDMVTKVEGTYKISAILTDGKEMAQTNSTLKVSRFDNSSNQVVFTVTYQSENGSTVNQEVYSTLKETTNNCIQFYDPMHYPNSYFAGWCENQINCYPLTGQGPNVAFYSVKVK